MQNSIWDIMYDKYTINNKIRLIECFAGYGSQALALKYLGADFEHWKICEWAVNSIIAYASVHREELPNYGNNFCGDLTKDQIADQLYQMGVSINYNEPASLEQLKRMNEDKLRLCFNSIMWSNNLVDITRVKGEELRIVNPEMFTYLLTYSFPCQDMSLAGKRANLKSKDNINNNNIYDIENRSNMLWQVERILSECKNKPQILLMENVIQVHGLGNDNNFKAWQLRLEELGYTSYWQDLSATDYGIPQTRNRCFMVSILGDYVYNFPKPSKLKVKLRDLIEKKVDDKFFLTEKQIDDIKQWNAYEKPLEAMEKTDKNNVSPTITTRTCEYTSSMILIKNATKKGYLEAKEGDGIDISSRMESHRGTVQKDKAQTITTMGGENVVVVVNNEINEELGIRKLTPRDCGRLMGVKDNCIDLILENQTIKSANHLFGDSIVVNCLMAIMGELLNKNWKDYFKPEEWWNNKL